MMVKCIRCRSAYSHARSTSALALTYCCLMCEVADLGYSLAAFEKAAIPELRPGSHRVPVRQEDAVLLARMVA